MTATRHDVPTMTAMVDFDALLNLDPRHNIACAPGRGPRASLASPPLAAMTISYAPAPPCASPRSAATVNAACRASAASALPCAPAPSALPSTSAAATTTPRDRLAPWLQALGLCALEVRKGGACRGRGVTAPPDCD
jgi:hypothetical protein